MADKSQLEVHFQEMYLIECEDQIRSKEINNIHTSGLDEAFSLLQFVVNKLGADSYWEDYLGAYDDGSSFVIDVPEEFENGFLERLKKEYLASDKDVEQLRKARKRTLEQVRELTGLSQNVAFLVQTLSTELRLLELQIEHKETV